MPEENRPKQFSVDGSRGGNMRDAVRELMAAQLKDTMLLERMIYAVYRGVTRPGDVCIDAGANLGLHTLPLAQLVGATGRVFAFEPIPYYARMIRKAKESLNLEQIRIVNKALYCEEIETEFHWLKARPGMSGIKRRPGPDSAEPLEVIQVSTVRLDTFVERQNMQRVNFIKMDIEGAEYHALSGGVKTLTRFRPVVVFEGAGEYPARLYGYTKDDFFDLFETAGYRLMDLFGQPFTRDDWGVQSFTWYFVATAIDSPGEQFVNHVLPSIVAEFAADKTKFSDIVQYGPRPALASALARG
jgi:FkbM family methyltransferase